MSQRSQGCEHESSQGGEGRILGEAGASLDRSILRLAGDRSWASCTQLRAGAGFLTWEGSHRTLSTPFPDVAVVEGSTGSLRTELPTGPLAGPGTAPMSLNYQVKKRGPRELPDVYKQVQRVRGEWGGVGVMATRHEPVTKMPKSGRTNTSYLSYQTYSFLSAALTNDHKLGGLKQHRFIVAPKSELALSRLKSRCWKD